MASSRVATVTLPPMGRAGGSASQKDVSATLTEEEHFELEQCRKIIQFRDEVFAGKHPKIKLPPHLAAKLAASANKASPPTLLPASEVYKDLGGRARQTNLDAIGVNGAAATPASATPDASAVTAARAFATGRTEIDPVLLEKSDHLIRAELGLQRQKLERALREEADQRKVTAQAGPPVELDVSDILAKAMALAQATTAPSATGAVDTANGAAERESSFDENDYYSSNHETLDSHDSPMSVGRTNASDAGRDARAGVTHVVPITSPSTRPIHPPNDMRTTTQIGIHQPQPQPRPTYPVAASSQPSRPPSVGTTENPLDDTTTHSGSGAWMSAHPRNVITPLASGEASRSDTSARMDIVQEDTGPSQQLARESEFAAAQSRWPPGIALPQNMPPIPPPVAYTSSPLMAGARQPPQAAALMNQGAPRGAPAQVAALRGEHQIPSSPESSSPHGKGADKKKGKKKNKRKADRLAQDAAATPYIKPEPRSPSPLSAPAPIRPAKRQRQARQSDASVAYEQPQPQEPIQPDFYHVSGPQTVERPPPPTYGRYAASIPDSSSAYGGQGYERVYHDGAHPEMQPLHRGHYAPQAPSPRGYPVQYAGEEYGPTRSVSYREPARYYQDEYAQPEPMGAPQRPPVTRVVVDAFGREYLEPPYPPPIRQSVAPSAHPGEPDVIYEGAAPIRHSVAPPMRPRDPEVIYERSAPMRAVSRRPPGPESYEEGGVVYRRASPPPFPPQRRVVTQPEYGAPEPLGYPRSYSVRPMAPPAPPADEYAHAPEGRPVEGIPRQYTMRPASARPLEPVRYDMPPDGSAHMQGRPEPPGYDMAGSQGRPEVMGPPLAREYAPRPVDAAGIQRPYSARPVERYYGEPQPMGEEVAYVERPPQHGVVYEPRREMYR